jgi:eukaryotic-like serine/threonine-protein kinase
MDQTAPVRFGIFEVDSESGELRKNGLKVPLQEQPFRVLTLLVEHPGKVITREELQQRLWPADTFVEFDRGLNTAINKVREALGDSATSPRFVETVPRHGYRFLAPVEGCTKPISVRTGLVPGRAIWLAALFGLMAGLTAGVALWRHFDDRYARPDPVRKFTVTPQGFLNKQTSTQTGYVPAISPNGRYSAYLAQQSPDGPGSIWVYDLETGKSRPLPDTDGGNSPFWAPGSNYIGFKTTASLKKVPINGGPAVTLASGTYRSGSWSPDGQEIVVAQGVPPTALYAVASVGGGAKEIWRPPKDLLPGTPRFVPHDPRSRAIVFVVGGCCPGPPVDLTILELPNPARKLLSGDASGVYPYVFPVWSFTGHLIYQRLFTDNLSDLWAVPFSPQTLSVVGEPFPIAENAASPTVSNDGTLVYESGATPRQRRLVWLDRAGNQTGEIGAPQLDMCLPSISPNGRFVAVEGFESETGTDIWLHDTARAAKTRLTLDPARDSRPLWSPDGKQVVFWSHRSGKPARAFIQNADGSGTAEPVADDLLGYVTDWSPDARHLLLDPLTSSTWCLSRLASGKWKACSPADPHQKTYCARFSPDGRFIAYAGFETGKWEVHVASFPALERRWHVSSGGGWQPVWRRNGKELFYVNKDTLFAVSVSTTPDFSFSSPVRLFSDPALDWGWPHAAYDVSRDGKRIAVIRPVGPVPQRAIWVVQNWFSEFRHRKAPR